MSSIAALSLRPAGDSGWIGNWAPGIGDPSLAGWLTVILYLATAWHCWRIAKRGVANSKRERALWLGLAVILAALGVNKQLDLQSAFTEVGRIVVSRQGLYEQRRELQRFFIEAIAVVAVVSAIVLVVVMRRMPLPTKAAIAGLCLLFAFVVIRAASFHHFDRFIGARYLGLRANWIIEMGALILILAASVWRKRFAPGKRSSVARRKRV